MLVVILVIFLQLCLHFLIDVHHWFIAYEIFLGQSITGFSSQSQVAPSQNLPQASSEQQLTNQSDGQVMAVPQVSLCDIQEERSGVEHMLLADAEGVNWFHECKDSWIVSSVFNDSCRLWCMIVSFFWNIHLGRMSNGSYCLNYISQALFIIFVRMYAFLFRLYLCIIELF